MLGKLIKYDFINSMKTLFPFYIITLALAAILRFVLYRDAQTYFSDSQYSGEIFYGLLIFAFWGLSISVAIFTLLAIIKNFSKKLLGREGYLMMTLPVNPSTHVISKLIVAVILQFLLVFTMGISIFLLFNFEEIDFVVEILDAIFFWLPESFQFSTLDFVVFAIQTILQFIVSTSAMVLIIYSAICIGHLANKNRKLFAVLAYFGINIVLGIVDDFTFYIPTLILDSFEPTHISYLLLMQGSVIIIDLIKCVCLFFIPTTILKTSLNLE